MNSQYLKELANFTLFQCIHLFEIAPPSFSPPPTYEEALGGAKEIPSATGHDTFGKLMFAPKYSYYYFPPATGGKAYPPATG